jgi:hypothetical protein
MSLTKEQLHTTAVEYLPRLGGFATKLAAAYLHADGVNQRRIENAFMHLFERAYHMWHDEVTTEGESK